MYKQDPFSRRGSLRSLRSAPLLSTVLESTLSLTRIHPIASFELPGLDYAIQSQSAIIHEHRELGTSMCGIAAVTAGTSIPQSQTRLGPQGSVRETKRGKPPQRALSRKLKPHLVADTVKQYISRAQRPAKGSQEQQPNMEFLRGVYAFMQVDYNQGYETITTTAASSATASFQESSNNDEASELPQATATTLATSVKSRQRAAATICHRGETSLNDNTSAGIVENVRKCSIAAAKASLKGIKESKEEEQPEQNPEQNKDKYHKMLYKRKHQKQQQQQ